MYVEECEIGDNEEVAGIVEASVGVTDDEEWDKVVGVFVEEECKLENPEGEIFWLVWVYVGEFGTGVNGGVRDGLNEAFSGVVDDRNMVVWVSFEEVAYEIGVNEVDVEERYIVVWVSFGEVEYEIGVKEGDVEERDMVVGVSFGEVEYEIGVNEGARDGLGAWLEVERELEISEGGIEWLDWVYEGE